MNKLYATERKLEIRKQRQEDRLHREFPAELRIISFPGGEEPSRKTIKCLATNISLSGTRIALATYTAVEVGTVARIRIKCGLMKSFTFTGTARNAKRDITTSVCFVGFEIMSSSARTLDAWRNFVASYFRTGKTRGG
ncbi:MAG: hypothetical protein V1929_11700 [bacterium]